MKQLYLGFFGHKTSKILCTSASYRLRSCPSFILLSSFSDLFNYRQFHFVDQIPLSIIHLYEMSHEFKNGNHGSNTTTLLPSEGEEQTDVHRLGRKGHDWSGSRCAPVIYVVPCRLKSWQRSSHFCKVT